MKFNLLRGVILQSFKKMRSLCTKTERCHLLSGKKDPICVIKGHLYLFMRRKYPREIQETGKMGCL